MISLVFFFNIFFVKISTWAHLFSHAISVVQLALRLFGGRRMATLGDVSEFLPFTPSSTHFTSSFTYFTPSSTHFTPSFTHFTPSFTHFTPSFTHFTTSFTHFILPSVHLTLSFTHLIPSSTHVAPSFTLSLSASCSSSICLLPVSKWTVLKLAASSWHSSTRMIEAQQIAIQ